MFAPESITAAATLGGAMSGANALTESTIISGSYSATDSASLALSESFSFTNSLSFTNSAILTLAEAASISNTLGMTNSVLYKLLATGSLGQSLSSSISENAVMPDSITMTGELDFRDGAAKTFARTITMSGSLGVSESNTAIFDSAVVLPTSLSTLSDANVAISSSGSLANTLSASVLPAFQFAEALSTQLTLSSATSVQISMPVAPAYGVSLGFLDRGDENFLFSATATFSAGVSLTDSASVGVSVSGDISTALSATIVPAYQLAGTSNFSLNLDSTAGSVAYLSATALMPMGVGTEIAGAGFGYIDSVALGAEIVMSSTGDYLWSKETMNDVQNPTWGEAVDDVTTPTWATPAEDSQTTTQWGEIIK
jgi:hypothetical protein